MKRRKRKVAKRYVGVVTGGAFNGRDTIWTVLVEGLTPYPRGPIRITPMPKPKPRPARKGRARRGAKRGK